MGAAQNTLSHICKTEDGFSAVIELVSYGDDKGEIGIEALEESEFSRIYEVFNKRIDSSCPTVLKAKVHNLMKTTGYCTVPCCPDSDFRERGDWNPFENI